MSIPRSGNPNWGVHPGEILSEEFLIPLNMKPAQLARELHVSAPTVNEIVRQHKAITADMAVRLARFFDTTEQFWLNLQNAYELSLSRKRLAGKLKTIKPYAKEAAATIAAVSTVGR
jgi:addiction module HigA family antidote